MTGGGFYVLSYDAENRLVGVKKNDVSIASFVYNGDGSRVKGVITETQTTTTLFVGGYFEWTGSKSTMMRYYTAGGTTPRLAWGDGTGGGGLSYLFGDHLGSTSVTYRISGTLTTGSSTRPGESQLRLRQPADEVYLHRAVYPHG